MNIRWLPEGDKFHGLFASALVALAFDASCDYTMSGVSGGLGRVFGSDVTSSTESLTVIQHVYPHVMKHVVTLLR